MSRSYTSDEIKKMLVEQSKKMSSFYTNACLNYKGKTKDTNEYYTEVIAGWLLDNRTLLDEIHKIERSSSYRVKSHDGNTTTNNDNSNRMEELTALDMYNARVCSGIGEIIDYQIPLKNSLKDKNVGKIDLLAYDKDSRTMKILELKKQDSNETMLRCVMEAYTYLRTVSKEKLLNDYREQVDGRQSYDADHLSAHPLVYDGKFQYDQMKSTGHEKLKQLMKELHISPYFLKVTDAGYEATLWESE